LADRSRKYCAAFPCPALAEPGSSYCRKHRPAPAKKEADPFYLTPAWRHFRNWYIGRHPLCAACEAQGVLTPAVIVDHIVELKDGGAPYSADNAQSLCVACHNRKTGEAKRKRKNHQQSYEDNPRGSPAGS